MIFSYLEEKIKILEQISIIVLNFREKMADIACQMMTELGQTCGMGFLVSNQCLIQFSSKVYLATFAD